MFNFKNPFFIISNPRSGTTFLHSLISLDSKQFVHIKLYHALFPSISIIKFIDVLGFFDSLIGRPLGRLLKKIEDVFFLDWQKIHPLGFTKPEEDEPIFILSMVTPVYYLLCPFVQDISYLTNMDKMPQSTINNMMSFYKNSLRRLSYAVGKEKTLLVKNALASGRIQSFLKIFPNSNYIYIYREPEKNISSLVSILQIAWQKHSPELLKDSIYLKEIVLMGISFYKHFLNSSKNINKKKLHIIYFPDLVNNPKATIEAIYTYFDIKMSNNFLKILEEKNNENKRYKSAHKHRLDLKELGFKNLKKLMPEVYKYYNNG